MLNTSERSEGSRCVVLRAALSAWPAGAEWEAVVPLVAAKLVILLGLGARPPPRPPTTGLPPKGEAAPVHRGRPDAQVDNRLRVGITSW